MLLGRLGECWSAMNEIFRFDEQSDLLAAHVFQEEIFTSLTQGNQTS